MFCIGRNYKTNLKLPQGRYLVPLRQEDRQQEDQGAYPEHQGGGDEEELGEAGGVMVVALGGHVLGK